MSTQKPKKIKAVLGFDRLADGDLVTRLNAVHDGMNNNPAYPAPPIDMPTLETNITSLTAAVAAAAADGGKKTVTEKNKQRNVVIKMLDHLAHVVGEVVEIGRAHV